MIDVHRLSGGRLGQYELIGLLSTGGMGAVYRALQPALGREVAIKVLPPALAAQPNYLERFSREARTAAALEHPHIVPVYDFGVDGEYSFVAMRLLTGGSLSDRLRHAEPFSPARIGGILAQIADALDYAHSRGVVHRDIKPSNIMFDERGACYLVDFGIAKLLQATTALTSESMYVGTPSYMAPEQWKGEPVSQATDQYALAAVTYQLLLGMPPFEGETPYAMMHHHLNDPPAPIHLRREDVGFMLNVVVERGLSKAPAGRYPSVGAFAQAFASALDETADSPGWTPPLPERVPSPPTRAIPSVTFPLPPESPPVPALPEVGPRRRGCARWLLGGIALALAALLAAQMLTRRAGGAMSAAAPVTAALSPSPTPETRQPIGEQPVQVALPTTEGAQPRTWDDIDRQIAALTEDAQQAMDSGDLATAQTRLTRALLLGRGRAEPAALAELFHMRGLARWWQGDPHGGLGDLDAAIALDDMRSELFVDRGTLRHALGDDSGALSDAEAALRLDPTAAYAHALRGWAHARLGDAGAAARDLSRAIRLNPDDSGFWESRGYVYFDLGLYALAERDFEAAQIRGYDAYEMLSMRAESLLALQESSARSSAIALLQQASALNPDGVSAYQRLGELAREDGDLQAAADHFRKAAEAAARAGQEAPQAVLDSLQELEAEGW